MATTFFSMSGKGFMMPEPDSQSCPNLIIAEFDFLIVVFFFRAEICVHVVLKFAI